jgi:hypothetical protein
MSEDSRIQFSLNGVWQFQPGAMEQIPEQWSHTIPVPALVDIAEPAYDWQRHDYHWYRKLFALSPENHRALAFLKIAQAMFGTEVWLNGKHLGGDIACYTSQEYDLRQALKVAGANELLVRVGAKHTLPPESAVGKDQEKALFIPGIWGDVNLIFCGNPRIKLVQVIPHINRSEAEVRLTVENLGAASCEARLATKVFAKKSGQPVSEEVNVEHLVLAANEQAVVTFWQKIEDMRLWSPDAPFLYELVATVHAGGRPVDSTRTTFGMREFKIVGVDFYLNGKRIFLKGGNIAFHRFLSDHERGTLPWQRDWIKRILIDIPHAHHFNFFRNHLGQMYNLWYDLADEHGMLLQNEWPFWTTTGSREQITKEFTRWLQDNWNHPSLVIWDALNESSDKIVQEEIVPEMKKLDPTRPWEAVDFVEQHPYIYSLGPVLNDRKFGFTESLREIERFATPSVVNEFLWWWLDSTGMPTSLMAGVVERWLGREYTTKDLFAHQVFLAQELVELFRRLRVDAIQPFVYLSNNNGPTAHWFTGHISELQPKPILATLKNAFAPFGISLELWDRHFFAGERRTLRLFVFNDEAAPKNGAVRYGVVKGNALWLSSDFASVHLEGGECAILPIEVTFPLLPGVYQVRAELYDESKNGAPVYSQKIAHVFDKLQAPEKLLTARLVLLDQHQELAQFLANQQIPYAEFEETQLGGHHVLLVAEGMIRDRRYRQRLGDISRFARRGNTLIVIEPELGVESKEKIAVLEGLEIIIEKRIDADKGGYDSYVFAEDYSHRLWIGIAKEHLKMFNGALGGEMVSEHNLIVLSPHTVLARCGLGLGVIAVAEAAYGAGKVIFSRLQLRGRLAHSEARDELYARRVDPVAQQYLLNLISYAIGSSTSTAVIHWRK